MMCAARPSEAQRPSRPPLRNEGVPFVQMWICASTIIIQFDSFHLMVRLCRTLWYAGRERACFPEALARNIQFGGLNVRRAGRSLLSSDLSPLDRPDLARRLTVVPYPRRIPAVLSVEEVTLLLRAATAPKYKAAFATAGACPRAGRGPDPWGAGLRVSEVVALKVESARSSIHRMLQVRCGRWSCSPAKWFQP